LVRGERHRLILAHRWRRAGRGEFAQLGPCAGRHHDQGGQEGRGQRDRPKQLPCHDQPSSVCNSSATASMRPDAAGAQAARSTGRAPDWPNSSATLEITNNAKPTDTPPPIIFATPPRRAGRMENPAATNAIVAQSKGSASNDWKCKRWRTDEKPDRSNNDIKSGSTHTDRVSGEAKLSCTRVT